MQMVRGQDWWFYKIPPLLAVGYATVLLAPQHPSRALALMFGVLLAICAVASFGYLVNDLFDVEQDRRSGKSNVMAGRGRTERVVLCVVPIGVAAATLAIAGLWGTVAVALLGLNLLLPALYSMPPVRLKERGLSSVLADAGAAHALPTALMITSLAPARASIGVLLASAVGWAFFSGVRGIIVHQVIDRSPDALAGVRTFGGRLGADRARALIFRFVVPMEVGSLLVFLALTLPKAPILAALVVVFAAFEIQKIRSGWKLPLFETPQRSDERYLPLVNNEFYELWLPLGLALQLALVSPAYVVLVVFQLVAFAPNLLARGAAIRALLPAYK